MDENNQADVHPLSVNADLENYYDLLNLKKHDRIVVPLCGKTQGRIWLKQKGIQVVDIELLCGDIFDITQKDIPHFNAIYASCALSALPIEMRKKYAYQLTSLSRRGTPISLVVSEIENHWERNPPFSITCSEINRIFERCFSVVLIKKGYKKMLSTTYLLERIQE